MDTPILPHEITTIYEGRIFKVATERVTLPKGHELKVDVIRHPGSIVLIPVDADGRIILVRQYRHAVGRSLWELPAGSLKPQEDPERAAVRECHEEIGLVPSRLERLGTFFPTPGYCDEEMVLYRATGLRPPGEGDDAQPDEDEDIETRAFAIADLRQMIARGELVDLKTVAGVFLISR